MPETAIAEHALIGDLQTAALVTTDGSIDWFCCPRFDSPSIFGALLDDERGGKFRIRPANADFKTQQVYFPDTAIVVTRFFAENGLGEVVDFMPPCGPVATDNHRLVRMVRCVRGQMSFQIDLQPRFDYGRHDHHLDVTEHGGVFTADGSSVTMHVVREPDDERRADAAGARRRRPGDDRTTRRRAARRGPRVGLRGPAARDAARRGPRAVRRNRRILA